MASDSSREEGLTAALEKVKEALNQISSKIDRLIEMDERILQRFSETRGPRRERRTPEFGGALDVMTLLSLPDHLRKSAMVVCETNGEATADEVAEKTGRARAVESGYLNQLVTMGHLTKKRKGRRVYFHVAR